ncbi:MAG: hypothetical protein HKN48_01200 [Flavobacteriaceae bacterium]|nr:hypothetical protein [Flavobacteriaceae bacterium]
MNKTYVVLFTLLLMVGSLNAQTFVEESAIGPGLTQKDLQKSLFSAQNLNPQNTLSASENNSIYIQQIGNKNSVFAQTRSIASNMTVLQTGNRNEVALDVDAAFIDESVIQLGSNNSFIDLNGKRSLLHRTGVIQRGRNQNLIMLGSNSISDKLKINMTGQKQTVIVRNIKRQ